MIASPASDFCGSSVQYIQTSRCRKASHLLGSPPQPSLHEHLKTTRLHSKYVVLGPLDSHRGKMPRSLCGWQNNAPPPITCEHVYMAEGNQAADAIKFANEMTLRWEDYPVLSRQAQ